MEEYCVVAARLQLKLMRMLLAMMYTLHTTAIVPTFRTIVYMLYINHGKEVYMANILPEVEGSMIRDIHLLTMVHTILHGRIT